MANSKNSKNTKKPATKKNAADNKQSQKKNGSAETVIKAQRNAIIVMGVAVIMLFVAFIKGQGVWLFMHRALYAGFGFLTILVPVYMIYLAFVYARDKTLRGEMANLIGVGSVIVLLGAVLHIGFADEKYFLDNTICQQLSDIWEKAPTLKGGGAVGGIFGGILAKLLGRTPALITLVVALAVVVLLVTGISLEAVFSAIKKPVKKVGEITNEKLEKSAQRREQIAAEKAEEEKAKKAFAPPAKPTITPDDEDDFSDKFVTDETTFDGEAPFDTAEPVIEFTAEENNDFVPEIPVIKLPDSTENNVVDDVIESAVEENKRKTKDR